MTRRTALLYTALALGMIVALVVLAVVVPRWLAISPSGGAGQESPPGAATRKIRARLFYVAEDGTHLVPTEQEVPFGDGTVEQAKRIVEAQMGPPPAPLASAIPPGTKLRALYLTGNGEAYVDLSVDASTAHPGGTMNEIFTVYAIVDALTVNLPAITGVQILLDGKEADTLAGHLDLRHPLQQDLRWVTEPAKSGP